MLTSCWCVCLSGVTRKLYGKWRSTHITRCSPRPVMTAQWSFVTAESTSKTWFECRSSPSILPKLGLRIFILLLLLLLVISSFVSPFVFALLLTHAKCHSIYSILEAGKLSLWSIPFSILSKRKNKEFSVVSFLARLLAYSRTSEASTSMTCTNDFPLDKTFYCQSHTIEVPVRGLKLIRWEAMQRIPFFF